MPILYDDARSRNGYKIRLLAAHLGLSLTVEPRDIMTGETRMPEFLKKNAAGRIPVLELDDGTCLPESNAALAYLAEGSRLYADDSLGRAQVLRWMFFEQNMIECTIGTARFMRKTGAAAERPDVYAHRQDAARDALAALNRHFGENDWAALGRFTIADIALYGYAGTAEEAGLDVGVFPEFAAWRRRVESLPGHIADDFANSAG